MNICENNALFYYNPGATLCSSRSFFCHPEMHFGYNPMATVCSSRRGFFVGQKCTLFDYNPVATVASSRRGFFVTNKCIFFDYTLWLRRPAPAGAFLSKKKSLF